MNALWEVKLQDGIKNIRLQPLVNSLHGGPHVAQFFCQALDSFLQLSDPGSIT